MIEWRVIPSDHNYEVSSDGQVRRIGGVTLKSWGNIGYRQVKLTRNRRINVHRLVAEAFLDPDSSRPHINHINGNRSDNRVENLERCTPSENQKHRYRVLGYEGTCKGKFSKNHPTSKAVIAIPIGGGVRRVFDCGLDAIRAGVAKDSGSITRSCQGKIRHHNGYVWSYA